MTQSRSGSSIWFILTMKQSIRGSLRIGRSSQECCGNISRVHFKTMINRLAIRRIQCLIGTGFRVDPSSATPCDHIGEWHLAHCRGSEWFARSHFSTLSHFRYTMDVRGCEGAPFGATDITAEANKARRAILM